MAGNKKLKQKSEKQMGKRHVSYIITSAALSFMSSDSLIKLKSGLN